MSFMRAVSHALIGYGIRRTTWRAGAILALNDDMTFRWTEVDPAFPVSEAKLLGPDRSFDISAEDITSDDWEAI